MVNIELKLDDSGIIQSVRAKGHAGYSIRGGDPACASISLLLGAMARTLGVKNVGVLTGTASQRGDFSFFLRAVEGDDLPYVQGLTDMLLEGCKWIQRDFPGAVQLDIFRGEEKDGT